MSKKGYIALYRQIQSHKIWEDKPFSKGQAWIDILLSVNYHDSTMSGTKIERGSWMISLPKLAARWGWSRNKVRTFLGTLQGDGMITAKGTAKGMALTVVNYDKFQGQGTAQSTAKGIEEGTAEGTTKGTAKGTHPNKTNNTRSKERKKKDLAPDFDFSEEEMARHDPKDEAYWREALRREREGTLYE